MTSAIEAVGVSRSFGGVPVVRDATLAVSPGEITALVGPNGSGKTTLMLILATLLKADSGLVRIGGHDTGAQPQLARAELGWMPDSLGSWPQLSVQETLVTVCSMYGIRDDAARQRADELLEMTSLTPLAAQRTNTLSRGQKQRLSLARAIAHKPRVLLLDEPASGLDPEARVTQRRLLQNLAAAGVAILVTSHVLDELDQLASSVVFLHDGRTAAPATVEAALRQGQSWRVRSLDAAKLEAALISMNTPWAAQRSLSGTVHTITVADESAAAAVLESLISAGVPVIEFGPETSALERAFVTLSDNVPKEPHND